MTVCLPDTRAVNDPVTQLTNDLIASYAREVVAQGGTATIVSSDKDLMQLIRERVIMLDPIKQKPIREPEVLEKFGVTPDKVVEGMLELAAVRSGVHPAARALSWSKPSV